MATPPDQSPSAPPTPQQQLGGRNPRTLRIVAVVVIVVVALAGIVIYYATRSPSPTCTLNSTNPLIFDQPENPDSLDPAVTFSTPGWGAVQQVYQTLVMYNNSDYKTFLPVLAQSFSSSNGGFNWTFHLRQGIHFSNGDPVNAYTMWFSLYRTILMNNPPEFILGENFDLPGLINGTSSDNQTAWMQSNMTAYLSNWNFVTPTPAAVAFMMAPGQSFQALDSLTLQVNLGSGYLGPISYSYVLSTLAAPVSAAVDPVVIQQHGGVLAGAANAWASSNMIGSGPSVLTTYNPNSGMVLTPDTGYWGTAAAAAEPWNNILQPAQAKIQINCQGTTQTEVQDLKSGAIAAASFAYVGPSTVNALQGLNCVVVKPLSSVYSSTAGGWWIYMNQNTPPFDNLSVRAAVVHAINYQEIINVAFGGAAQQWVGPVPPGYPNYNPGNLPNYSYNLTLAKQEMNNSPYPLPGGFSGTLKYEYINLGDWGTVAQLLKTDLAKIGITIDPVGIPLSTLYSLQLPDANGVCAAQDVPNNYGGPFPIGQEFYTSDYIAPDDWTQNNAISWGSANACMSAYNDPNMDTLVLDAASNPANATADYTQMTRMMYDNYTNAWLVVPQQYQIYNPALQGVISNPMGSGLPFTMMFNTEHA